jgi:hypothetical protein
MPRKENPRIKAAMNRKVTRGGQVHIRAAKGMESPGCGDDCHDI